MKQPPQPWQPDAEPDRPGICSTGVETALLIGAAVAAAGTAATMVVQGQQAKKMGEYNAALAENQQQAARNATQIDMRSAQEASKRRLSAIRAAYGGSMANVDEGSPLLVLTDQAQQAEEEVQRLKYSGNLAAQGYEQGAQLARFQGQQAEENAYVGAGVSLLSSGARIGTRAYERSQLRMGSSQITMIP